MGSATGRAGGPYPLIYSNGKYSEYLYSEYYSEYFFEYSEVNTF